MIYKTLLRNVLEFFKRDHWLYKYMRDNDHDGLVGE